MTSRFTNSVLFKIFVTPRVSSSTTLQTRGKMSSENASQTNTSYCFRCNHHPCHDDEALKRCSRCRARCYCSSDCQRRDWPRHKIECCTLADGGEVHTTQRTIFRVQGSPRGLGNPAELIDPDVIYYLKTSKPHIQDVSISGPFYPLEKVFDQLHSRIKLEQSTGEAILDDLVLSGMFLSVEHFNVPIPGGHVMRFQLIQEKNTKVAESLPGTVWNVVVASPDISHGITRVPGSPHPPVDDIDIHATFLTMKTANSAAETLLEEMKAMAGRDATVIKLNEGELVQGFISPLPRGQNPRLVEVRRDDGQFQ